MWVYLFIYLFIRDCIINPLIFNHMKKKLFAILLAGMLTTGSLFATMYKYYIKCKDGTEQTGWLSAPTTSDAFEMLGDLADDLCG